MEQARLTNRGLDSSLVILICSKHPNTFLYANIEKIRDIYKNAKIAVIDSDSEHFDTYTNIKESFPEVDIHFLKNKNYEYGAWKIGYELYPNYDIYMCIQDALLIQQAIDLTIVNSNNVYTFFHCSGFLFDIPTIPIVKQLTLNTNLNYENLIPTLFNIAAHSSFIVNNYVLKHMYSLLIHPPISKIGGRAYERIFGLYFILHSIKTHPMNEYFTKLGGGRY